MRVSRRIFLATSVLIALSLAACTVTREQPTEPEVVAVDGDVRMVDVCIDLTADEFIPSGTPTEAVVIFEGCCAKTEGLTYKFPMYVNSSADVEVVCGRYHVRVDTPSVFMPYGERSVVFDSETREEHAARKAEAEGITPEEAESAMAEAEAQDAQKTEWLGTEISITLTLDTVRAG